MWLDQVEALSPVRRCVALDLPGFGRSDPLRDRVLTMSRLADDLAEFIGNRQADVVALSMGGYVALALWERHPHVIRSLSLLDTRSGEDSDEGREGRRLMAEQVADRGTGSLVDGLAGALLAPDASVVARARLRGMIESTAPETVVAALEGMARRPDRTGLLATITVPTLVLVGQEDRLTPPTVAEAMAALIPDSTLVTIPGAGHLTPVEAPGQVGDALREFWA
ncbi:2-hydroxy-6-oxo-6-(2'-aminophenyl)hexa-2, 4-dienoic acid hydrolase [bacterium BMS3Abin02]|nr:2-hydroxy-6-oxo-6-(2'-aminophenyl)hexa-2, 4-dienoic acid hydrolase [bacterium BMS3Abin02]GBE22838.1 2-hydroxy-6-oxo-6-(2'-aminophenyl)hexa-2, 4-dienoic acid hydrolase [bacterium BMS3Bbin01]